MLRITIHDNPAAFRLKLEGKLTGPWVTELEQCCCAASSTIRHKQLVIDLTEVEFVDTGGKSLLTLLHKHGAKFISATLTMRQLVYEIAGHPEPEATAVRTEKGDI